jgi:hypothetical protein
MIRNEVLKKGMKGEEDEDESMDSEEEARPVRSKKETLFEEEQRLKADFIKAYKGQDKKGKEQSGEIIALIDCRGE